MDAIKEENGDIMHFIKEKKLHNKTLIKNITNESNNDITNNEFQSELNEEKIKNLKIQYDMFRIFIYKKLRQKEYKTVVNQIEGNYQIYKILEESEELLFLKIEILIKIIQHKIDKYDYINEEETLNFQKDTKIKLFSPNKYSSKILKKIFRRKNLCKNKVNHLKLNIMSVELNIEKYYITIYKEIKKLIEKIPNIYQNSQIIYIEKIIQLFLRLFLVKANHHEKNNQLLYSIYYLSLGKKLILKFNDYIRDIKTFSLIEKLYLYLAKLLFINKDFHNVQKYCNHIITYCFKELVFIFGDKININPSELKNEEKKIFFYLCNALLYIGFCKEENGEINIAFKLYIYVNYIYKYFLNDNDFKNFVSKLYMRVNQYSKIFKEFFQFQTFIKGKNIMHKKIDLNHKISYFSNTYHNRTFEQNCFVQKIPSIKNNNIALSENSLKFESENIQFINSKEPITSKNNYNLPIMNKKKVSENENLISQKTIHFFSNPNSSFNLNDFSINKKMNSSSIINLNNHKFLSDKITRNFKENVSMVIKVDNERKDNNNNNNKNKSDIMINNNNSLIDTSNSNQILLKSVKKINSCSDINSNDDNLHLSFSYNLKEKKYYFFPYQLNNSLIKNFFSEKKRKIQNLNKLEVKKRNFNFINYSSFKKDNKYFKKDYFVKFQNQKKKELNKINFDSIKTLYISSPPVTKIKNNIFSVQSNEKIPFINILNLNKNKKNETKKIIFSKLNLMKPLIKNYSNEKNQINNDSTIIKIKKRFNSK